MLTEDDKEKIKEISRLLKKLFLMEDKIINRKKDKEDGY